MVAPAASRFAQGRAIMTKEEIPVKRSAPDRGGGSPGRRGGPRRAETRRVEERDEIAFGAALIVTIQTDTPKLLQISATFLGFGIGLLS